MIDFSTLQGLTIPEGVVTQIADASGRVIWAVSGGKVILEVEKITSDTYAGETTYTAEEFILLDIYPKTNGTVSVTYGGLTKTITDTSGAEEPNAQQVFFGTFNGVTDSVATPASGTLTIEGDYTAFGCSSFDTDVKGVDENYTGITEVKSFGAVEYIPDFAFGSELSGGCKKLTSVTIPSSVLSIGISAFASCLGLQSIDVDINHKHYSSNDGILFNKNSTEIYAYPPASSAVSYTIPYGVTTIKDGAFSQCNNLSNVTIPSSVLNIGSYAFSLKFSSSNVRTVTVLSKTPATLGIQVFNYYGKNNIVVPSGCGDIYKTAEGWSNYADYITEAS